MERLNPLGHDRLRPGDLAPPLDFGLAGLPDWAGIRVADRLGALRRNPLAMESEHNRPPRPAPPCSVPKAAPAWTLISRSRGSGSARRCGCVTPPG